MPRNLVAKETAGDGHQHRRPSMISSDRVGVFNSFSLGFLFFPSIRKQNLEILRLLTWPSGIYQLPDTLCRNVVCLCLRVCVLGGGFTAFRSFSKGLNSKKFKNTPLNLIFLPVKYQILFKN